MGTRLLGLVLASAVMVCGSLQATAAVVFFDNFEHYGVGAWPGGQNWNPPATSPWVVTSGTIDLVPTGPFPTLNASVGSGLMDGGTYFLDLDGSTNNAGTLLSIDLDTIAGVTSGGPGPFTNLIAGEQYRVEFIMAGNQRINAPDTVNFGVALGQSLATSSQLGSVNLGKNDPWTLYSYDFTYIAGYSIFFDNQGGDNQGALLDNVRITAIVPVPPAAALVLLGMVGVGLRRKLVRTA